MTRCQGSPRLPTPEVNTNRKCSVTPGGVLSVLWFQSLSKGMHVPARLLISLYLYKIHVIQTYTNCSQKSVYTAATGQTSPVWGKEEIFFNSYHRDTVEPASQNPNPGYTGSVNVVVKVWRCNSESEVTLQKDRVPAGQSKYTAILLKMKEKGTEESTVLLLSCQTE